MELAAAQKPLKRSNKRTEGDMRNEMLAAGGHLITFNAFHPESTPQQRASWLTVQRKGFLVFRDTGCLVPHQYYRNKGVEGPARIRGHIAALEAFVDPLSDRTIDPGRNDDGWPMRLEVSHYCHNPLCCHPGHLGVEERWRNWRRNYCTGCDCGQAPACLGRYHPHEWWVDKLSNGQIAHEDNVSRALVLLRGVQNDRFEVKALPRETYRVEDDKADHRRLRRKRGRAHEKQRQRNLKRRRLNQDTE